MFGTIEYFEKLPRSAQHPVLGGIYWAPFPFGYGGTNIERAHMDARPHERIDVTKFNPEKERYDKGDNTQSNEFLAIRKFKYRPVIALSGRADPYTGQMQATWMGGNHVVAAPIYSVFNKTSRRYKFPAELLIEVILYQYAAAFFLPGSRVLSLTASIVRLEYAQSIHVDWLEKHGGGVVLQGNALYCLQEWFSYYLTGEVSQAFAEDLDAYRETMKEEGTINIDPNQFPDGIYDDI